VPSPSVETFLASLKRCLAAPGFLESFYERFIGSSEEVRERFRNTDMKRQVRVLEDSLYVVANAALGEADSLARGALPDIAARHSDIPSHLFDLWIECFVETARQHDPSFDPAVEEAWRETLTFGADRIRRP